MTDDRTAQIRDKAYQLWQAEGEPHGRHDDHWSQAERELGPQQGAADSTGTASAGEPPMTGTGNSAPASADTASQPASAAPATKPAPPAKKDAGTAAGSDDLEETTSRRRAPNRSGRTNR